MAISLLVHTIAASSNDTSVTSSGIDTTGGTLLIAGGSFDIGTSPALPPVDNKSNTLTDLTIHSQSDKKLLLAYCASPNVGSGHTFSFNTGGGASYPSIAPSAWSGVALVSPFDQQNGNSAAGSLTIATGSITPTVDGCLIIAVLAMGNRTWTVDSGFTALDTSPAGGHNYGLGIAYLIQGTAAAVNPVFTLNSSDNVTAMIASFKPATASGGGPLINGGGLIKGTLIRGGRLIG